MHVNNLLRAVVSANCGESFVRTHGSVIIYVASLFKCIKWSKLFSADLCRWRIPVCWRSRPPSSTRATQTEGLLSDWGEPVLSVWPLRKMDRAFPEWTSTICVELPSTGCKPVYSQLATSHTLAPAAWISQAAKVAWSRNPFRILFHKANSYWSRRSGPKKT